MANNTKNYNLIKPTENEVADIGVINSNMDVVDEKLKKNEEAIIKANNNLTAEVAARQRADTELKAAMINENLLINGGFDIWQRGTEFTMMGGVTYGADMWYTVHQRLQYTRAANTSPSPCDFMLRVRNNNDADGGWTNIMQKFERNFVGEVVTLSFYVRSINGDFLLGDSGGEKIISESWEYITSTFRVVENIIGIGSSKQITDTTKGFEITAIKLELGDTATRFVPQNYGTELAKCQRYYEKGFTTFQYSLPRVIGETIFTPKIIYKVSKRLSRPTMKIKSVKSNNIDTFYADGSGKDILGTTTFPYCLEDGFNVNLANINQSIQTGEALSFYWEASCEL